jgi:fused signal recognition particle receptor
MLFFAFDLSAYLSEFLRNYPTPSILLLILLLFVLTFFLRATVENWLYAPTALDKQITPPIKDEKKQEVKEDKKPPIKDEKKQEVKEDKKPPIKDEKKQEVKEDKKPPIKDEKKQEVKEDKKPPIKDEKKQEVKEDKKPPIKDEKKQEVKEDKKPPVKDEKKPEVKDEKKPEVKDEKKPEVQEVKEEKPDVKEEKKPQDRALTPEEEERRRKRHERTARLRDKREVHVSEMEIQPEEERAPRTLREGLEKTRKGLWGKLNELFLGKKTIEKAQLDELETILLTADVGVKTTQQLIGTIEEKLARAELKDVSKVKEALKDEIYKMVSFGEAEYNYDKATPYVIMVVGVNGVGKTTTIGKIAARLNKQGKSVLLAAGDTFRAAADSQLEIWSKRADAELVRGQANQDPSSVIFEAVQKGVSRKVDVVLADTAGRLHTQQNLMEELKKIRRTITKAYDSAPHEVLLVLDATIGQNALNQAKEFNDALGLTGLALTKLDGTAKGGVVVAICNELKLPVRYIGVGEHIDELRIFSASEFVDALFEEKA